jgi:hypothetical protein
MRRTKLFTAPDRPRWHASTFVIGGLEHPHGRRWKPISTDHADETGVKPRILSESAVDIVPQIMVVGDLVDQLADNARPESAKALDLPLPHKPSDRR